MEENLKSIPFEHLFEITHRVCTEPDLIEVNTDSKIHQWTEFGLKTSRLDFSFSKTRCQSLQESSYRMISPEDQM